MNRRSYLLDAEAQQADINTAERAEHRAAERDWPPSIRELMRPSRDEAEADDRGRR